MSSAAGLPTVANIPGKPEASSVTKDKEASIVGQQPGRPTPANMAGARRNEQGAPKGVLPPPHSVPISQGPPQLQNSFRDQGPPFRDHGPSPHRDQGPPFRDQGAPFRDQGPHGPSPHRDQGPPFRDQGPHGPSPHRDQGPPFRDQGPHGPSQHHDQGPPFREGGPPPFGDKGPQPFREGGPPPFGDQGPPPFRDGGPPHGDQGPHQFRDQGPPFREGGPPFRDVGPPFREGGPPFRDDGPPFRERGPQFREGGPPFREGGPPFREGGPPFRETGPPHRDQGPNQGPPFRDRGPPQFHKEEGYGDGSEEGRFGPSDGDMFHGDRPRPGFADRPPSAPDRRPDRPSQGLLPLPDMPPLSARRGPGGPAGGPEGPRGPGGPEGPRGPEDRFGPPFGGRPPHDGQFDPNYEGHHQNEPFHSDNGMQQNMDYEEPGGRRQGMPPMPNGPPMRPPMGGPHGPPRHPMGPPMDPEGGGDYHEFPADGSQGDFDERSGPFPPGPRGPRPPHSRFGPPRDLDHRQSNFERDGPPHRRNPDLHGQPEDMGGDFPPAEGNFREDIGPSDADHRPQRGGPPPRFHDGPPHGRNFGGRDRPFGPRDGPRDDRNWERGQDFSRSDNIRESDRYPHGRGRDFRDESPRDRGDGERNRDSKGILGEAPPGMKPLSRSFEENRSSSGRQEEESRHRESRHGDSRHSDSRHGDSRYSDSRHGDSRQSSESKDSDARGQKRSYTPTITFIICVSNMPLTVTFRDVRHFFNGIEIPWDGMKLINDNEGNRIGKAYIRFDTRDNYRQALNVNSKVMNGRKVDVRPCSLEEWNKAVDSYIPNRTESKSSESQSTTDASKRPRLEDSSRKSEKTDPKSSNSEKKSSSSDNKSSSSDKKPVSEDKKSNSPEKKPASQEKLNSDKKQTSSEKKPPSAEKKDTSIVQLKGLGMNVIKEDVRNFFKELKVSENAMTIYIEYDIKGRATGIGFVEFTNASDQEKALKLDGRKLSQRIVRVCTAKQSELDQMTQRQQDQLAKSAEMDFFDAPDAGGKPASKPVSSDSNVNGKKEESAKDKDSNYALFHFYCAHMQGLPPYAGIQEIQQYFQGLEIVPRGVQFVKDSGGKSLGEAFIEFVTKGDCEKAVMKTNGKMSNNTISVKGISKSDMNDYLQQTRTPMSRHGMTPRQSLPPVMSGGPPSLGPPSLGPHPHGPPSHGPPPNHGPPPHGHPLGPPPHQLGRRPAFFLRAQNLPFTMSIREVHSVFKDFDPIYETIKVQIGNDSKTGGTFAIVGFRTPEERDSALNNLHQKVYRNKTMMLLPA